jgi:hypothetical protein
MFGNSPQPTPLTLLSPIKNGCSGDQSYVSLTRAYLQSLNKLPLSPMAAVPNTFLCRFYILNDVFFEGSPAREDHLQSKYLVFCSNFHGDLETYLRGFWQHANEHIRSAWRYCVGFDAVNDVTDFIAYIKKCMVKTTFYFNGSTGAPLKEQLKALYLKQELSAFVSRHQGDSPEKLRAEFMRFLACAQPDNLDGPSWAPGLSKLGEQQTTNSEVDA